MGVFDLEWIIGALIKLSIKQSLLLHPSSIGEGSGHQSLCGTLMLLQHGAQGAEQCTGVELHKLGCQAF